jgi:hypothetical protein
MLQWHFNCFIFEVEIAEYRHEGVDTTDIAFRDNEPCVQLIESPYMGIISKLDDSCIQGDTGEIEVKSRPRDDRGGISLSLSLSLFQDRKEKEKSYRVVFL